MTDMLQALANRLQDEGARVGDFFNHLSQEQWENDVYIANDRWTFHRLLAHFVSAEIGRYNLIVDVIRGGMGAPPEFDIDGFNRREVDRLSIEPPTELLNTFTQERTRLIELVSTLKLEDLERIGNDPFLGEVSLADMIKLTYRHIQIHLRDARRCL